MANAYATLILTPAALIAACDDEALQLFGCEADRLLGRPAGEFLPGLPLRPRAAGDNIRVANQFGGLVRWLPLEGRRSSGRHFEVEVLLSRCGYRPCVALWLLLRPRQQSLELKFRDFNPVPTPQAEPRVAGR